jgi:hypothetical protein
MMTSNLANYLYSNEILYKNVAVGIPKVAVIESVVEPKVVVQEPISAPIMPKEVVKLTTPTLILKHKVLVLTESISENEKVFLAKILNAVGLSLDNIDLIELNKVQRIDYQLFIAQNVTKKFISFGVGLGKLNWDVLLNLYQNKNVAGIDYLLSDELRIVEANLNLKKNLWAALKSLFENT